MTELFTNHGTGDAYMTLAFAHHKGWPVVYGNPSHAAIAAMFPHVPSRHGAFGEVALHVHPEAHPPMGISRYALLGRRVTHADLWRGLLDLPLDAEMGRGQFPEVTAQPNTVVLIPEARSIPNSKPQFWDALALTLRDAKWNVFVNDRSNDLEHLLRQCAAAEWVIGPQCGVMAILCHAMFPCRKTIATPSVDGSSYYGRTFPYMGVQTFAGEDYDDVEEIKVTDNIGMAIADLMAGRHASGIFVSHSLVSGVPVTLAHGDFLDRASILEVKHELFDPTRRALIHREYLRYMDIAEPLVAKADFSPLYRQLKEVNRQIFMLSETIVPNALNGKQFDHDIIIKLNKLRVQLKNHLNLLYSSESIEAKSYYGMEKS